MAEERGLLAILERDESGKWSKVDKDFDEFSEATVEDDIIIGFNVLVRISAESCIARLQVARTLPAECAGASPCPGEDDRWARP